MDDVAHAFDAILALALVGLAARILTTRDLFKAVVLFIVFGLLMALTWARLDAPDIALAEAAIGAGLTGALLIEAVSATRTSPPGQANGDVDDQATTITSRKEPAGEPVAGIDRRRRA